MKGSLRGQRYRAIGGLLWIAALINVNAGSQTMASVQQNFIAPPDDARVMMRWWWFGPAVTHAELRREILAMKA
jgi:hypothetical protein